MLDSTQDNETTGDGADATPVTDNPVVETSTAESEARQSEDIGAENVGAKVPQFASLASSNPTGSAASISRFFDVKVTVSAELGQVVLPIGELLQLSEGSVIELNRSISESVDLMAQGVRIARGEVVVIDDCFAIRIKEIEATEKVTQ